jgi:cell division protein FtsQ
MKSSSSGRSSFPRRRGTRSRGEVGAVAAQRRTTARATTMLPAGRSLPELARLAPSGRSLLLGLVLLAVAVGGYLAARETALFAVREVSVTGATPQIRATVRAALRDELGQSLLRVDGGEIGRRLAAIPSVRGFTYDRAFPHTLRIVVRPERPVLIVRQGAAGFLVAASGRVLRTMKNPHHSALPRLYVRKDVPVVVGERLPAEGVPAATALAALRGASLPGGVRFVRAGEHELTLVLGSKLQLRLGDSGDLRLKLAIARRILAATGAARVGGGYLDVSVPERPVLTTNSQVAG